MSKDEFERLADGLLYQSETDSPLSYLALESNRWPPSTAAQFLELIGEDPETPIRQTSPEQFFQELQADNEDREDQIKALQNAFAGDLEQVRGYRVGEVEIEIYLLGKDASGQIAGLQTLSVET